MNLKPINPKKYKIFLIKISPKLSITNRIETISKKIWQFPRNNHKKKINTKKRYPLKYLATKVQLKFKKINIINKKYLKSNQLIKKKKNTLKKTTKKQKSKKHLI